MKLKKILSCLISALLVTLLSVSVFAASVPVITYDGSSYLSYTDGNGNALSGNSDFGTAFSGMLPGVEYTQNIVLKNADDGDTIRYYMDLGVLRTLQAAGLDGAGYSVTLKAGSNDLYTSSNGEHAGVLIGGSGSGNELEELNSSLYSADSSGILVATLAPGESTEISLSIKADATMSDAYQNAQGTLSFQFFGELVPANTGTNTVIDKVVTVYVQNGVQTGDGSPIYIIAAVLVLALIVFIITGKRNGNKKAKS